MLLRKNLRKKQTHKISRKRKINKYKIFLRKFGKLVKNILIVLAIFGFILAFYKVFLNSGFFKISNIQIFGTHTFVNKEDITSLVSQKVNGENIFSFDKNSLENALKDTFLGAKNITVKKKLPNKIIVSVSERVPLAIITNESNKVYFMVDDEGYVLGIVDVSTTNLPQITYYGDLNVGKFIDPLLIPLYLDLLHSLDTEQLKVSTISVNDNSIDFFLKDNIFVLIGKNKNMHKSVKIISELLKQLKLEGKNVTKIDLRYDKVIVEY